MYNWESHILYETHIQYDKYGKIEDLKMSIIKNLTYFINKVGLGINENLRFWISDQIKLFKLSQLSN